MPKPKAKRGFEHRSRRPMWWPELMKILTHPDLPLKPNQRLVALVILSHIDLKTMTCYPSQDLIRRRARVSRNTVSETIKRLEELKLIAVSKQRQTEGRFDRNLYDFNPLRTRISQK